MRPIICASGDVQGNDEASLAPKQPKGYRVFQMDGCSFLVKEVDSESRALDLNDIYVIDSLTQETRRPTFTGDMPSSIPAQMYREVEWASYYPGNEFEDKEPITWVMKVYLIAIKSMDPYELDFDTVFVLNAADGSMSRCPVKRLAPSDTPEHMLQIRIRETGITIDTSESLPDPETVVQSKLEGHQAMSMLERALEATMDVDSSDTEEKQMHGGVGDAKDEDQEEEEDDDAAFDDEDDSLSDFLTEVDDDSDSEFDDDVELDDEGFDDDGGDFD